MSACIFLTNDLPPLHPRRNHRPLADLDRLDARRRRVAAGGCPAGCTFHYVSFQIDRRHAIGSSPPFAAPRPLVGSWTGSPRGTKLILDF